MFRPTISLAALALAMAPAAFAHGDGAHMAQSAQPTEVTTTDMGGGIYMLVGRGGNLGVLTGEDGTFVIDSQYADMAPALLSAIDEVADTSDIRFLFNTHWHGDHTGGNVPMAGAGATIVAHDGVRRRLTSENTRTMGGETTTTPPAPQEAWPVISYSDEMTLYLNGQTIHVVHLADAHTDGDSALYFEQANVLHTGDVMFNGRFPFVDVSSGGTFAGYIAGLEKMHALINDDTRIIPGHGPEATRADIMTLKTMMEGAVAAVQAEFDTGKSLEDIKAAKPLAEWDEDFSWGFIDADTFTSLIHADLTAASSDADE